MVDLYEYLKGFLEEEMKLNWIYKTEDIMDRHKELQDKRSVIVYPYQERGSYVGNDLVDREVTFVVKIYTTLEDSFKVADNIISCLATRPKLYKYFSNYDIDYGYLDKTRRIYETSIHIRGSVTTYTGKSKDDINGCVGLKSPKK